MTNTIILNSIAHLAACVFIGSQYSSQCGKKRLAGLMTFLLALLVAPEFLNLPGPLGVVRIAFQALFMITVSMLILKGFERKILIICFSGAVFSTPGNIIGSVMFQYIPDSVAYQVRLPLVILVSLAIHAIMLVVAIIYYGNRMRKLYMDRTFPWISLFLVPLAFYCSIYSLRVWPQNFSDSPLNMVTAVFVSLLCISSYYLALKIMDYQTNNLNLYYSNQEYELLIEQMKTRVDILGQKEQDSAIIRHNERHLVNLVRQLIEDGEYDIATSILDSHLDTVEQTIARTFCKNVVINCILEAYVAECERSKIAVSVQADIPEKLPVREMELAMVLSNLLENAVLAAKTVKKDPKVTFLALKKGNKLIFEITNSFLGEIIYDEIHHIPVSAKGEGHGLGMQSIMIFAEKNGAVFDCSDKDGTFIVRLLLQDDVLAQFAEAPKPAMKNPPDAEITDNSELDKTLKDYENQKEMDAFDSIFK